MTPLRQRMLEDLQVRNYAPATVAAYIRNVAGLAKHFGKSPELLGPEQVREYQLHLIREIKEKGASLSSYIQAVCGLRFLYTNTLHLQVGIERIPLPRYEKKLPVILSKEEVKAMLEAPRNLGHRAILASMYGCGLRVSEVTSLKVCDIDGTRKVSSGFAAAKETRTARSCSRPHYVRCSLLTFAGNAPSTGSSLVGNQTAVCRAKTFS